MPAPGSPAPVIGHDPVFDLCTGAVVGTRVSGCALGSVEAWAVVARQLTTGVPGRNRWWVSTPLASAVRTSPEFAEGLLAGLGSAQLPVQRLVVEVGRWRPGATAPAGLDRLLRAGASIEVDDDPDGLASALERLAVARVCCRVAGRSAGAAAELVGAAVGRAGVIGAPVIVEGVSSADQLTAAVEGGATLARGPWWGMPGPLRKVIVTWQRSIPHLSG